MGSTCISDIQTSVRHVVACLAGVQVCSHRKSVTTVDCMRQSTRVKAADVDVSLHSEKQALAQQQSLTNDRLHAAPDCLF